MKRERGAALGQDIARLKALPVFACLDDEALKLVAFSAEARRLPAGHVLFRRGEAAEGAVLVATGTLALDEERQDSLSVRWVGAGTLLNEAALFAPGVQVDTATADIDSTVVTVSRALMARVLDVRSTNVAPLRRYWAAQLGARLARFKTAVPP